MSAPEQPGNGNLSSPTSMSSMSPPTTSSPPSSIDIDRKRTLSSATTPFSPIRSPTDETLPDEIPLAAQLPISTFASIPKFPPEASHLRSLTFTSDIPLPEYQSLVSGGEYTLPVLPQSITHLTFELFSLGFPGRNPRYLSNLAAALPNLKSITAFACLLDGLDDASRTDAEKLFDLTRGLREIHLIDTFVRPGYWTAVGKLLEQRAKEAAEVEAALGPSNGASPTATAANGGLQVVEVSYTYRGHSDSDFLARVHGEELPLLIIPGLVGLGFGFVEEAQGDKDLKPGTEDSTGQNDSLAAGILPYASDSRATSALKRRFAALKGGQLASLKVLNLNMWTLTLADLKDILASLEPAEANSQSTATGLIDLTIALLLAPNWLTDLASLLATSPATNNTLHSIEIVGVPLLDKQGGTASGPTKTDEQIDNIMDKGEDVWGGEAVKLPGVEDVKAAFGAAGGGVVKRFEVSVLKAEMGGKVRVEL